MDGTALYEAVAVIFLAQAFSGGNIPLSDMTVLALTATLAAIGDGGIGMFVADLKLAVQYRLPLLVVLMRDGYFGSIRTRSLRDGLTERPVTITEGTNRLCTPQSLERDVEAVLNDHETQNVKIDLWDGHTAGRVVESIKTIMS